MLLLLMLLLLWVPRKLLTLLPTGWLPSPVIQSDVIIKRRPSSHFFIFFPCNIIFPHFFPLTLFFFSFNKSFSSFSLDLWNFLCHGRYYTKYLLQWIKICFQLIINLVYVCIHGQKVLFYNHSYVNYLTLITEIDNELTSRKNLFVIVFSLVLFLHFSPPFALLKIFPSNKCCFFFQKKCDKSRKTENCTL